MNYRSGWPPGGGTRGQRRISNFDEGIDRALHEQAAADAAQADQANAGAATQPVYVDREFRGRLGARGTAIVGGWTEIARFSCFESYPMTIQSTVDTILVNVGIDANNNPILGPMPNQGLAPDGDPVTPRILLRVQVGSGNEHGGSDVGEYILNATEPFEVVGTRIVVSAQIFSDEIAGNTSQLTYGTVELDPSAQCSVVVTLGMGSPTGELATKWILPQQPLSAGGTVQSCEQSFLGPCKMKQAHGFNAVGTAADILYLMFFDATGFDVAPLGNSAVPVFTIPVPGGSTPFSWDCIESSRLFQRGLAWALSDTPEELTLTAAATAGLFRVDIELMASMQTITAQLNS
jgi:hypothetical protein